MKIINDIEKIKLNNTCVTVGKFDGFHLGHRMLLDEMSKRSGLKKVVVTFDKTPAEVLRGETGGYILTQPEKQKVCGDYGVDAYVCIPLTKQFLSMSAKEFISDMLVGKLGAKCIVTGENFRFGKGKSGNAGIILKYAGKYGYDAVSVKSAEYNGGCISSTRIRQAIETGHIEDANNMLGYPYIITGIIRHGRRIGTGMELPTANIVPDKGKIMPPRGVYKTIVVTQDGRELDAVSNIGVNPTVGRFGNLKIESHILNFEEEIYGEFITVKILKFVRPEKKFKSIDELKKQINSDIERCRTL